MSKGLLTLNTGPTEGPVSLQTAKDHLRVSDTEEDILILSLISSATKAVEADTGKALVSQTWDYKIAQPSGRVCLPMSPVSSVSSLTYFDTDDVSQTLTVSDFYLQSDQDRAWIEPKQDITWPTMRDRADALTITFVAGFGAATAVPADFKQAILLLVAHWFENRVAADKRMHSLPLAYEHLTFQQRVGWVG